MAEGFNWFLIIVVVVVAVIVLLGNVYVIVHYQHPEDKNQAWLPKFVVWFGLSLAVMSVLMFPLDVANRGACREDVPLSSCDLTLPMRELWFAVYIANAALVFLVTPFTLFYYEAGSDRTFARRVCSALVWVVMTAIVLGLVMGITYALVGYVEFPTQRLESGVISLTSLVEKGPTECIEPDNEGESFFNGTKCDALDGPVDSEKWKLRTSFPVYVVAISSIIGWVTFIIFGGVGVAALPADLIRSFFGRPVKMITRSEYIKCARLLGNRAREIKDLGEELRKGQRADGRTRKWRKNFKELNKQLITLEEEHAELELQFPQGEDGETKWVLFQLGFYVKLFLGLVGVAVSIVWIVHIVLYMLLEPPVSSFLNNVFIKLDKVFPLFGTAAFALFCLYLIAVTIKGHMKLGLHFGFLDLYPVRPNGTMMNSMLVNTALVLLSSTAVIQFSAEAFAVYAQNTAIEEIFGNDIDNLIGIKYLYRKNVFLYAFLGFAALGCLMLLIQGPEERKKKKEDAYVY